MNAVNWDAVTIREDNYQPKTPERERRLRGVAYTRQLIEARQKELRAEIETREAELTNLELEWDNTCAEWDRLFAGGEINMLQLLAQSFFIIAVTGLVFGAIGILEKLLDRRNRKNRRKGLGKPKADDRSSIELHNRILAKR